ncbi:tachylectin-related carbohydrate-binding protein [Streptomyces sp. NBC_00124]|uniref:tachylectin-related carbohydrate-binding protein n=1 Tax=Streptomyces sp. NBC_00124 TaxID=2975662 RepID=UPI0022536566|nr:tachylectin-related carbohydrate-binding protein [Streptomyces sp. NBC_00124]MCX5367259.1 tachylectin-related carbohydrate-binding protein [Streptomyces sp. NBC_00124]
MKLSNVIRRTSAALAVGAMSLGLVTVAGEAAQAVASCTGNVSIYGTLADGRLTYSQIEPNTGDRVKTLIGPNLGFTPKTMATLNFNTVLVTSTAGDLYRVDIQTNNTALALAGVTKIWDGGWTFDKMVYDGAGHLYGTVDGQLHQYLVSQDKPSGSAHIGQHVVIDTGFVLKTLAAAGDDRIIASTSDGRLLSYKINGVNDWDRAVLKSSGWSAVDSLASPGGGLYYGRTNGGMYWYHDSDPTDADGSDIAYHPSDPVDASGWTQSLLSAYADNCAYVPPAPAHSVQGGTIYRSEVMTRAKDWYNRNIQYSQSAYATDIEGDDTYRTDCSGFVSMAWHLTSSLTTQTLDNAAAQISKADLRPGDALNSSSEGHAVLFAGWKDQDAGTFYYYSEGSPDSDMNYRSANAYSGTIDSHPASAYVALRYNKIA